MGDFAKYFQLSPEQLDLEDVRQYTPACVKRMLHLTNDRRLSPESINTFVTATLVTWFRAMWYVTSQKNGARRAFSN